jgi:elongation factor G
MAGSGDIRFTARHIVAGNDNNNGPHSREDRAMPDYTSEAIRNVALVGHGGVGKTMLAEALLHKAGAIGAMGELSRGTTVSDFDDQEKAHQHSLQSSLMSLFHDGCHVNLIDTPGYPDFLGRALSVLPAVETAAVVIDARSGVDLTTRRMMKAATSHGLCRLIVVNKIDADDLDFDALMHSINDTFGSECLPINLPAPGGGAVVDCFFRPSEAADTAFSSAEEAHTRIVDQVVEVDEELMEKYLEQGEDLEADALHDAFLKAMRTGHLVPVCFTSVSNDVGVAKLLEVITRMMPNPIEGNRAQFQRGSGEQAEPVEVSPDPGGHVMGHVFKVSIDPFVGRLSMFRVHQGTVTRDSQLLAGDARKPFKVGHLFRVHGKDHEEVESGIPGDIRALAKVDDVGLEAVLHDSHDEDEIRMRSVVLPEPMYGLAISTRTRGDEQKLSDALHKLSAEDPCFVVEHQSTGDTVIRGLGELHMRMVLERMQQRFNVEVETRPPRIDYRETIRKPAEGHYRHKKQTGGAGQFGEVYLRVEPLERGGGFEFVDKVVGGVIPGQFIPAVEKGVRQVLDTGAVAGFPMQDVRVTVYDGKHHPVDSKEVAFATAARRAFLEAVQKSRAVVLEPVVEVHVTVPQESLGDITGDLSAKRGRISGTEALGGGMIMVTGLAPLAELTSFQSELKAVTGGAGSYSMNFSHYDPVPPDVQRRLASEYNPVAEED